MRLSLTLFLCFFFCFLAGQSTDAFVDVVHRYEGDAYVGKVTRYQYGKEVVIRTRTGRTLTVKWADVKRVSFRRDETSSAARERVARPVAPPAATPSEVLAGPPPARKWRHQITGNLNLGTTSVNDFGIGRNTVAAGIGLAYHVIRPLGPLRVGAGLDLNLLNHVRQELVGAATVFAEYVALPDRQIQPLFRIEGGPTLPFGGGAVGEDLSDRQVSPLLHPAVGVVFNPRRGSGWSQLTLDLGYRFLNSRFTLTTADLDVIERRINYRRLVLRGGIRF